MELTKKERTSNLEPSEMLDLDSYVRICFLKCLRLYKTMLWFCQKKKMLW